MNVIETQNIYKNYNLGEVDVPVLKGVSMGVAAGEFVALMGASGSGKSTLMNILGCLDKPTSGRYLLDGEDVSNISGDRRALFRNQKIGFVFQNFNLLRRTTALDNVMMPLAYGPEIPQREARQRAVAVLEQLGLGGRMHHEPSQLSGGQQQRVAIARALINNPSILLADEPTGNLDSHTSEEILSMFQKLNVEKRITIVLVTHDQNIARHASRTISIRDGVVVDHSREFPSS